MLECELDAYLDYDKHSSKKEYNTRNGYLKKDIKTSYREEQLREVYDFDVAPATVSRIMMW